MQMNSINDYLNSTVSTPYFLFISDDQYLSAINELQVNELALLSMSSFCSGDDKIPDIDGLISRIEAADVNANGNKFVVTGLGESLALRGTDEAKRTLSRLKDLNVGGAKVILLLRGLGSLFTWLETDLRFDARRHEVVDRAECNLSFRLVPPSVSLPAALTGFKSMLVELEKGQCGNLVVSTNINFDNALFTVSKINNAYEGIVLTTTGFDVPQPYGNDEQWAELLAKLNQNNDSFDKVLEKYGFNVNLETDFYGRITGGDFRNWLYFIALKQKTATLKNSYLRFVLEQTSRFEDFKSKILNAIIDVSHTDKDFDSFYTGRKALVEKFPESDIADFVFKNRKNPTESIYKLTDSTSTEREEIIAWVSQNGFVPQITDIYPALAAYLKQYVFNCGELSSLLTDYFDAYKRQKVFNKLEKDFLDQVDKLAVDRKYNRLSSRSEVLDSLDKDDTYLYWLDALGVEYLAYISEMVRSKGLSISISTARAELPTITSINKGFFDKWQGPKNGNNGDKELDEVKHNDAGGYNFTDNELPIHLAKELDIISAVIEKAATALALRRYKRFLVVSDHGASRLAVLHRKEEQYETDTKGEHSGRCCKLFGSYDLPFAAEENGYLVLADYGRFKGSRAANVEVHGGASLEEVVVPVIELSLKDGSITVELVDEKVPVDPRTGTTIKLFFNSPVQDVSVVLNGKRYFAKQTDDNHYSVELPDTKRTGEYPADVYAGGKLIGKIMIKAQSKIAKVNDGFDDLFRR